MRNNLLYIVPFLLSYQGLCYSQQADTTQQLLHELANLKELMEAKLNSVQVMNQEKFNSIEQRFITARVILDNSLQSIVKSNIETNEKLQELKERLDKQEGRAMGIGGSWAILLAVLLLIATVSGLIINWRRA